MQNESSGAGCHAIGAQRPHVGRGTGTTALLAESTAYRTPQGRAVVTD
jgi:hypothetical protein